MDQALSGRVIKLAEEEQVDAPVRIDGFLNPKFAPILHALRIVALRRQDAAPHPHSDSASVNEKRRYTLVPGCPSRFMIRRSSAI